MAAIDDDADDWGLSGDSDNSGDVAVFETLRIISPAVRIGEVGATVVPIDDAIPTVRWDGGGA